MTPDFWAATAPITYNGVIVGLIAAVALQGISVALARTIGAVCARLGRRRRERRADR